MLGPNGPYEAKGEASPFCPPCVPVAEKPNPVLSEPPAVFRNKFDKLNRDCRVVLRLNVNLE